MKSLANASNLMDNVATQQEEQEVPFDCAHAGRKSKGGNRYWFPPLPFLILVIWHIYSLLIDHFTSQEPAAHLPGRWEQICFDCSSAPIRSRCNLAEGQ